MCHGSGILSNTLSQMNPQDSDDIPDPTQETIEFIADMGIRPAKRPAEQGVEDMKRHLQILRQQLVTFLEAEAAQEVIANVEKDIRDTELRLKEYQAQLEGRN